MIIVCLEVILVDGRRVRYVMAWWYDRRCGFHVKTWGSGQTSQVLSHWRNKYTSSPITYKMDAPSKNINAVPDQQPFTVLVTGANRQVVSLPHDSNDG